MGVFLKHEIHSIFYVLFVISCIPRTACIDRHAAISPFTLLDVINSRVQKSRLLLTLRHLHNRLETERKKREFSWKRQNRQSAVLRLILQPFKMSKRYTIYIFGIRKAWGIQPCASLEVEKSRSKIGKFFIFIFSLKKSIFSEKIQ